MPSEKKDSKVEKQPGIVFAYGSDDVPDLLANVACMTRFLRDVSQCFGSDSGEMPLSDDGTHGLFLILAGMENTIDLAIAKL